MRYGFTQSTCSLFIRLVSEWKQETCKSVPPQIVRIFTGLLTLGDQCTWLSCTWRLPSLCIQSILCISRKTKEHNLIGRPQSWFPSNTGSLGCICAVPLYHLLKAQPVSKMQSCLKSCKLWSTYFLVYFKVYFNCNIFLHIYSGLLMFSDKIWEI